MLIVIIIVGKNRYKVYVDKADCKKKIILNQIIMDLVVPSSNGTGEKAQITDKHQFT